jgi:peptidoglycan/xylan/chitin deacetylase (PgdA/CDA1 family)
MSILCYHAVDPCWQSPLAVTPEAFESHCAWLARHRSVVPLEVALARMDPRGRLPRGMVALTFDDGFAQLADLVFPALARHGLPATVFLVAATLTEQGHPVDWVDTPPDWQLRTLTSDQVLAARAEGIAFQSHSWAHRTLSELDESQCETDLRESRTLLEDLLHEPVDLLAYPRGRHDASVRRATQAAGFRFGLALPEGREEAGRYAVPRVGVFPGNGDAALRLKTHRRYLAVRRSRLFPAVRAVGRAVS